MCYLIAKKYNEIGSVALKTEHGTDLVNFKNHLYAQLKSNNIQLVTISRPSAYGEYEPYTFTNTHEEFEKSVLNM